MTAGEICKVLKGISMDDIDQDLRSYKEHIQDRIAEFQPLLDACMDGNLFDLMAEIKVVIDNLHEHLDVTVSALTSNGKRKRYFVGKLADMERLDFNEKLRANFRSEKF